MDFSELSSEKMYSGELEGYTSFREASRRSLARVFGNMEKLSYIIVSGSRGDLSNDINKKRFQRLKDIVKDEGFSFIPVKGGFIENKGEENESSVYEDSLIIFPIGRNNEKRTDKELFDFGLDLIQYDPMQQDEVGSWIGGDPANVVTFGQDSFLFKGENKAPTYYDKNGDAVYSFSGKLDINNGLAEYFTQLMKDVGKNNIGKFTFKEAYVTYEPRSIQSRHIRYLEGELVNSY